jgi:CBS domain containing-hemolysin-like protein
VYRDRVDQIVGLCNVFDVLYDRSSKIFLRSYLRPVRLVPDTKPIDVLFVEMQAAHENLVVVVNEFGACIGIVSIEDIIEEIFGDIADEHEALTPEIRTLGEGHVRVSGLAAIYDLNEETGWELPAEGFQTVAGYVLWRLGRIPRRGEHFTDGDLFVRVVDADRYAVKVVEILQRKRGSPPADRNPGVTGGGI